MKYLLKTTKVTVSINISSAEKEIAALELNSMLLKLHIGREGNKAKQVNVSL